MNRRNFLKVAGATGALIAVSPSAINGKLHASNGGLYSTYERVQLVDASGAPIKASALKKETNYVFNYPYASTPAILLDLDTPTAQNVSLKSEDGEEYIWKSGVGAKRTIVAYTAICSHQLAHPTPNDSFLQYCQKDKTTMAFKHGGVMVCSSHLSSFDVSKGCKNLSGPAGQPLASVILEVAEDDTIWAVAVLGADKFHEYFKAFKPEFKMFYGGKRKAKELVKESALTVTLSEYTKEIIQY
ncbi:twin-arginine translocation signal domain-containing protein [bacterium]|nr:twin-arginine translocation signal domain-containing protein [bacterium]MBU1989828.1 twin-arginine translocation signal domain-containing protein [bacterium]